VKLQSYEPVVQLYINMSCSDKKLWISVGWCT